MACDYLFLDSAHDELAEIASYLSATTGSNMASSNFLKSIHQVIDSICEFPTMYAMSRMPELANNGYRVALTGTYILLYTFENETIYIAHIFHQRQDYAHLL